VAEKQTSSRSIVWRDSEDLSIKSVEQTHSYGLVALQMQSVCGSGGERQFLASRGQQGAEMSTLQLPCIRNSTILKCIILTVRLIIN